MKFLIILMFSFFAHADRYIVSGKDISFLMHNGVSKKHLSIDLTEQERDQLVLLGYGVKIDRKVHAFGIRSLSNKDELWGYYKIRAHKVNKLDNGSGEGSTVCVIDTGVDYEHRSFKDKIVGGIAIVPTTINDKLPYYDDMGHGTHVAGIVAGEDVGIARASKLYIVKVLDHNGEGYESDVADAILSCVGKSDIINLSLGGPEPSNFMQQALDIAKQNGMINICAAGNDAGSVSYPASYSGCIAVSAIDKNLHIADFSNTGKEIAFAGPGVGIKSTVPNNGYEDWDGTSMAAPHVSAVAAIMLSRSKKKLRSINLGLQRDEQGKGLIDAYRTGKGYFWEN